MRLLSVGRQRKPHALHPPAVTRTQHFVYLSVHTWGHRRDGASGYRLHCRRLASQQDPALWRHCLRRPTRRPFSSVRRAARRAVHREKPCQERTPSQCQLVPARCLAGRQLPAPINLSAQGTRLSGQCTRIEHSFTQCHSLLVSEPLQPGQEEPWASRVPLSRTWPRLGLLNDRPPSVDSARAVAA